MAICAGWKHSNAWRSAAFGVSSWEGGEIWGGPPPYLCLVKAEAKFGEEKPFHLVTMRGSQKKNPQTPRCAVYLSQVGFSEATGQTEDHFGGPPWRPPVFSSWSLLFEF